MRSAGFFPPEAGPPLAETNFATEAPDLFINAFGRTKAANVFPWPAEALCRGGPIRPRDTRDFDFLSSFHSWNFALLAKYSTAMRPVLWRVPSYSYPGFPKPAIIQAIRCRIAPKARKSKHENRKNSKHKKIINKFAIPLLFPFFGFFGFRISCFGFRECIQHSRRLVSTARAMS